MHLAPFLEQLSVLEQTKNLAGRYLLLPLTNKLFETQTTQLLVRARSCGGEAYKTSQ